MSGADYCRLSTLPGAQIPNMRDCAIQCSASNDLIMPGEATETSTTASTNGGTTNGTGDGVNDGSSGGAVAGQAINVVTISFAVLSVWYAMM